MKAEHARKMTDDALAALTEALQQGRSEALTRYLAVMARFHRYSFGNILLIMLQKPDATHVAGFHTWKDMGRYVKKGEKGIAIMAPMIFRRRESETHPEEPERSIVRFKAVHVFDVTQTEGQALPEFARIGGDPGACIDRLKACIADRGIRLSHEGIQNGALGVSTGGEIRYRADLTPAQTFEVLAHELAHEMLHHGEGAERGGKAVVETEAEAVAFVVCHAVGLQTGTASSDYIQLHRGTKEMLAASLERIQKTAASILLAVLAEPAGADQPA